MSAACGGGGSRTSSPGGALTPGAEGKDDNAVVDRDVDGLRFFMFSYEAAIVDGKAVSQKDASPAVSVDHAEAKAACYASGYRLCTLDEWQAACQGPERLKFGVAATADGPPAVADTCDVAREDASPGDLPSKTGSHADCKTKGLELYDMIGNAAEWVDDGAKTVAAGVAFHQAAEDSQCVQTPALRMALQTMDPGAKSTDLGFRCCKNSDEDPASKAGGDDADTGSETGTGSDTSTASDTSADSTDDTGT
jgi:formylglycine-generating enzyme required for sulfatase activity